jgi:hypothetical protein
VLQAQQRIGRPLHFHQRAAQMFPQPGIVGPELDRLVEDVQCFVVPSLRLQRDAEAAKIIRFGVLPDRTGNPVQSPTLFAGVERQQAHQMQRVGMARVGGERLLTTMPGIEMPPGTTVAEPGLMERRRRGRKCMSGGQRFGNQRQ